MPSKATARLGQALRYVRAVHDLSQRALGEAIGASQSQVNKLENGQTEKAGVSWLEAVCEKYGIPWSYFYAPGPDFLDIATYIQAHRHEVEAAAAARRIADLEQRVDSLASKVEARPLHSTEPAEPHPDTGARRIKR